MTDAVLKIKQWGNSLGVRLPTAIARAAHLRIDQRVRVSVKADQVVITPIIDAPLGLEQRLAAYDPRPVMVARSWLPANVSGPSDGIEKQTWSVPYLSAGGQEFPGRGRTL